MAFEQQTKEALRILEGIERGSMSAEDSSRLVEDADPALIYLLFTWLRQQYGGSNPASEAVLGRLVAISSRGAVASKMKKGQADPVVEWFEESYSYRNIAASEFVEMIVEKIEG